MEKKGPVDLSTAKVISDTLFVSASRIFVLLLKPVRGIILGRLLGPTLYGILNIPVPYVSILSILSNIGFSTAIVKLIPDYRQKKRADLARMIYRSTAVLTIMLSAFWCILLIVFSGWIAENITHRPDALTPMRVYAVIIPFLTMNTIYGAAYLAVQRGKLQMRITLWHGLLSVLLPITAVLWRRNITLIIGGFLAAEVIGTVLFASLFRTEIKRGVTGPAGSLARGSREVWNFGRRFFFATFGWNLILLIDKFMVQHYLPVDYYGYYYMSALVITALTVATSTAGLALVPSLTAARTAGDESTFKKQIWNTSRLGFMTLIPVVALIYVLIGDVFAVILPKFLPSVPVIKILSFIGFVLIFCRIAWAALVACGHGKAASTAYGLGALWNFVWNLILIPRYGIEGAAAATLSTFVMLALLLQAMMWRASRTRIRIAGLLHPLAIALVFPLFGWLLAGGNEFIRIAAVIVCGCFCYVTIALLTGLVRGDDLEKAGNELKPRAEVPHVRLTLKFIELLETYRRIMRGKNT